MSGRKADSRQICARAYRRGGQTRGDAQSTRPLLRSPGRRQDHARLLGRQGPSTHRLRAPRGVAIRERAADLAAILTNLDPGTVLFIDEIHRLSHKVEELLYPALESGRLDIILGKGPSARTVELILPAFTHRGRDHAVWRASLGHYAPALAVVESTSSDFYSEDDLRDILKRSAKMLELSVPADVIEIIAARSRATPRVANALLKRVRDYSEVHNKPLSPAVADEAFKLFGVDALGLTKDDKRYLETLESGFRGGPAGVNAVAAALHEDPDTVEHVYEPYLLRLGLSERSSRGRILTQKGREYLGGGDSKLF